MSLETHRIQVETAVKNFMAANYPTIPIQYENAPFTQPDGPFIAVTILNGESFRVQLGSRYRIVNPGIVQIDVLTPKDTGTSLANQIIDRIIPLFQEKDIVLSDNARVIYRAASPEKGPAAPEFYRSMVRIGFVRHENY